MTRQSNMSRRHPDTERLRRSATFACLMLALIARPFCVAFADSSVASQPAQVRYFVVKRVIDGDTIQLANGDVVRLIGVDTPELKHPRKPVECFGSQASLFTRTLAEGQRVTLS